MKYISLSLVLIFSLLIISAFNTKADAQCGSYISVSAGRTHTLALMVDGTVWVWGNGKNYPERVPGLSDVIQISAGSGHSVAIKNDGTVWTWGSNSNGQLGDGTTEDRTIPQAVPDLADVVFIEAGYSNTFAIRQDGTAYAWGSNSDGELGIGDTEERHSPVPIQGLSNITSISAKGSHTLALLSDGTVWAWGLNNRGQLGDGTTEGKTIPTQVPGIADASQIAAGETHSITLISDGTVWVWGSNTNGELGLGPGTSNRTSPVQITDISDAVYVDAGTNFSIIQRSDNSFWATGNNSYGQLCEGTLIDRRVLVPMQGLNDAILVSAGYEHAVALMNNGTAWAWGRNISGNLGNGIPLYRLHPVRVIGINDHFVMGTDHIAAGGLHTVGLRPNGTVWSWGFNNWGQLGDGTNTNRTLPVYVESLKDVSEISTGYGHSAALMQDGTVWTWGYNQFGQLGDGTNSNRNSPVLVSELTDILTIVANESHTLALRADRTVWAWGRNNYGQLGDGTNSDKNVPVQVQELENVIAIAAGGFHSLALLQDGTVMSWGYNQWGQLGDETVISKNIPVQVSGLSDVVGVTAGNGHSIALDNNGVIWVWGRNNYGQLGTPNTSNSSIPVQITMTAPADMVSAGQNHTAVILQDGTVWTWGRNNTGQIGDGTTTDKHSPFKVTQFSDAVSVASGVGHTLVVDTEGRAWAWGWNGAGQIGDDTTVNKLLPVEVKMPQGAIDIGAGRSSSVALNVDRNVLSWGSHFRGWYEEGPIKTSSIPEQIFGISGVKVSKGGANYIVDDRGFVWAWGYNADGQLGDGTTTNRTYPVKVRDLTDVVAIAAGGNHALALKADGTVWAWGSNFRGQLGDGTTINSSIPIQVSELTDIVKVAAGLSHSLALKSNGTVFAWGVNGMGQLGIGYTSPFHTIPIQAINLANILDVFSGDFFSAALGSDGKVWTWGHNNEGQLGDGIFFIGRSYPARVPDLSNIVSMSVGGERVHAVKSDGTVWSWGSNNSGELGDGTRIRKAYPVLTKDLNNVAKIAAGVFHTLALKRDSSVWAWGSNAFGQLGNGEPSIGVPMQVICPEDSTPPLTPTVTDEGEFTSNTTVLSAAWIAEDPETGIGEYQYAIGTTSTVPEEGLVVPWKFAGLNTQVTESGLSLEKNVTYYWYVRAMNWAGQWSEVGISDGVTVVPQNVLTPGEAKQLSDDTLVSIAPCVVTAQDVEGRGYIQCPNRSSGIAFLPASEIDTGSYISAEGTLGTNDNGERVLEDVEYIVESSGNHVLPVILTLKDAASGPFHLDDESGSGQRGITDPPGYSLSTIGLLINVVGYIVCDEDRYLVLDDGSWPGSGARVAKAGVQTLVVGDFVSVTGISSIRKVDNDYQMLILPRSADDISVIVPAQAIGTFQNP